MLAVRNEYIELSCSEAGSGLSLTDRKRGVQWVLDGETQICKFSGDDEHVQLVPVGAKVTGDGTLVVRLRAGGIVITNTYQMVGDYVEVALDVPGDTSLELVTLPGSFGPCAGGLKYALPIMQGMQWDGRGTPFGSWRGEAGHGRGFSMPFIGYMGTDGGLLFTAETADNVQWWVGKDEVGRTWATNAQVTSLGTLGGRRSGRLYVTDADVVSLAKTYRRKVKEQGRFVSWEEKLAERPGLERLFGSLMCFIGYCQDDIDYVDCCRKLKESGFDRALVYPYRFSAHQTDIRMGGGPAVSLGASEVAAIKDLGFDVAPWTWINEALDDGTEAIRKLQRRTASGEAIPHWAIDDQQWYLVCSCFLEDVERKATTSTIADATWDHFDVLSCATVGECYALDHPPHMGYPLDKTADRKWIGKALAAGRADGRAVSSESFNDAYSLELDLGSVKAWPRYGLEWRFWPIPLTMLVYHDSIIHSWWELHNYNNSRHNWSGMWGTFFEFGGGQAKLMASLDALMGCPPDVFPFGAQYGYTGKGQESYLYKIRLEDEAVQLALREALPVARLHRRIGKLEMVHFAFLSDDGNVQETAFADGTRVVANFGTEEVPGGAVRVGSTGLPLLGLSWWASE